MRSRRTPVVSRSSDLDRFYALLGDLADRVGGSRRLAACDGRMDWPERGVYFFCSPTETHAGTDVPRVVRVGTHAVSTGSKTTLWNRLRTHRGAQRGTYAGGGNHRGSVFRRRVGEAIRARESLTDHYPQWGVGSTADREVRLKEHPLERRVSEYVGDLPFLWVALDDEPGPESDRAFVEEHAIALLSNYRRPLVDERPPGWLGRNSESREIRESGLWNVDHVDAAHDPAFLDRLADAVADTTPP